MLLLLSCLDSFAFLYSAVTSLKSMVGMVLIGSLRFGSFCPCSTSGTGWLQLSSVVCFSSYFALSRFAVLWFALPAVGYALLLPAVALLFCLLLALLFSVLLIAAPDLFSLSSYPCCFTSSSPLACWLWFCLRFSPLAPWLWYILCFFFRVTLW